MKSIRNRFLIAALAVVFGTALANAQTAPDAPPPPPMHGHEFGMFHMIGFFAKNLDLTDTQKAQMKDILEKERPTLKPLKELEAQHQARMQQHMQDAPPAPPAEE